MGYTTDFSGEFKLNKKLSAKMQEFLKAFNETRRMGRKQPAEFGVEGEFFVGNLKNMGQDKTPDVIDQNTPPRTQPGLWCGWEPSEDGLSIRHDGGEKFYYYTEWLLYLIHKILAPNGYILNGEITWQGEETGDVGELTVVDNKVFVEPYKKKKREIKITDVEVSNYVSGKGSVMTKNFMHTDIVLIIDKQKEVKAKAPAKPKSKSVVIRIDGLKESLDEKQLKTLLQVVRQYSESLVDKTKSEYTIKHKKIELKGR